MNHSGKMPASNLQRRSSLVLPASLAANSVIHDKGADSRMTAEGADGSFSGSRFVHDFSRLPASAVHETAARGVVEAGGAVPHAEAIQRSFGRHLIGDIRAHVGGPAALAAQSIGASAYAMGDAVAFDRTPNLRTTAHEAAHVIQQRGGVNLPGGVGMSGDRHERHAEAVADLVAQGRSAEHLLDQYAGETHAAPAVQRLAFVNETQITISDKSFTPEMKSMVSDPKVRNYTAQDEFRRHAGKQTDYLGNLTNGTWLRFSPTGINLLGEDHTKVTLEDVLPAVDSKSFIYEPISSDTMKAGSSFKGAYETENQDRFKKFGIDKEPDKQPFGAESLYAKMGFNMMSLLPFFDGTYPVSSLTTGHYFGQPAQRYLKIGWGWSKDNKLETEAKLKAKQGVPPKFAALATVHAKLEGQLGPFITALPVDGYLGDALVKKGNDVLLAPLLEFSRTFTDAMVRVAAGDISSRLSMGQRSAYAGSSAVSDADKTKLFTDWRNFNFEDNVKAAAKRGVRYAGMGKKHLEYLEAAGLEKDQHPFDMDLKDITAFTDLTEKLKKAARKP
jgi:Domain of unknown function (DUF4157)